MIWLILLLAFAARTYRVTDFLGFWFDQGRDALVISNLLHAHKFFLIGPTTGIEGIFLGPFYYYLLSPFYWLGRGNPIFPAIFLAVLSTGAIYIMYRLTKAYAGHWAGVIAAALYAFSWQLIGYNRWLANPAPLPFFALLALWWTTSLIYSDRRFWLWPALGLVLGLSLQLEAASATFFLPVIFILFIVYRKKLIANGKKWVMVLLGFGATLIPQLWFDFRNQHILFNSFYKFLVSEKSFQTMVTGFYSQRLQFYFNAFTSKFVINDRAAWPVVILTLVMAIVIWRKLPKPFVYILLTWWITPLAILLFYHGNHGYVWDYYFTGVYPAVCILMGTIYAVFFRNTNAWKWLPVVLVIIMLGQNSKSYLDYYQQKATAPFINLTSEVAAVDWVYTDAGATPFNTDEYVPPVIPYAYEYVFQWRGMAKFGRQPNTELVSRLYTLREPDGEHPQFLAKWQVRQDGIGKIDKTVTFDAITVERRTRLDVKRK